MFIIKRGRNAIQVPDALGTPIEAGESSQALKYDATYASRTSRCVTRRIACDQQLEKLLLQTDEEHERKDQLTVVRV